MRVLWVVKGLGPGGAERLLSGAASRHDPDEFDIECAYVVPWKDHLAGELEAHGVRTHCLSTRDRDARWIWRLTKLVRDGEFDVVHVHSPLPGSVARLASRSMRRSRRPAIIATEHNRWATHRAPTRALSRLTSRWNDATLAVTDEVSSSLTGPAAEQAVTLRHGIDVEHVRDQLRHRSAVRRELELGPDEFVVGTIANFRPQKDYPNLLTAAARLRDRGVDCTIVAVGQGPDEREIRQMRADLGLDRRVRLTGYRPDATRLLAACDAFTLASQWEGLPVALMEALALGLPIVATDVGGMSEELTDGIDAVLVPPRDPLGLADGIERLAADADLRSRLAAASTRRSSEFGVDRTVRAIEDLYRSTTGDRPVSRPDTPEPSGASSRRTSASPARPDVTIRPAATSDRSAILSLLRRSLGADDDSRLEQLFSWKHDENPFGRSAMWVATHEDRVVAFRAFMRWNFVRGGVPVRAARAVDTATDPDYQRIGLFRALTLHGLEHLRDDGIDFIFNTPNATSRPGYLQMGWRPVGSLRAAARFSGPSGFTTAVRSRVPAERWSLELDIGTSGNAVESWRNLAAHQPTDHVRSVRTDADEAFFAWRYGNDLLGYRVLSGTDATMIVRLRRRGEGRELAIVRESGDAASLRELASAALDASGASHTIRIGQADVRRYEVPIGGPLLTWRGVNDRGPVPLPNWDLTLGDVELF